jgi:hypothetical protein
MRNSYWFPALMVCAAGLALGRAQEAPPARGLITKETRQAIDAGLAYLAREQAADGSWGTAAFKGNVGITGLAGLAFLANGQRPGRGPHGKALDKAVDYLLSQESKTIPGYFTAAKTPVHGPMYGHGYAVLFLAEVQGVLPDKDRKARVREALERAVKLILGSQNNEGGWRYHPKPLDADITVTACQLHALRAARDVGIGVPKAALDQGQSYVLSCQDLAGDGGFRYMRQAGPTGFARTAAAVSALNRTGLEKGKELEKGLGYLRSKKPGGGKADPALQMHYYYGYYYAAQALQRAGGKGWQDWYSALRADLLRPKGDRQENGSWDDRRLCAHYSTAMALLILQTPESRMPGRKR